MSAVSSQHPQVTHDIEIAPYDGEPGELDTSIVTFEATVGDHLLRLEIVTRPTKPDVAFLAFFGDGKRPGDCFELDGCGPVWPILQGFAALLATAERDYPRLAARAQALGAAAQNARQRLHPAR